ncbi:TonB-linked outer membrane protein, SusC/RagA family [Flavobacterium gillisiae]|uniref:TonB-linked outer membrane protein, SusC/RagA family n=1 Tax=Flavobacterium gillisiae TaxID=150146 RepID=A0A1H3X3F4_9FLAO|nr:SusC/RagA family TonB-linked outer membrane protein [Flavobacterium gillisiae]SDZ93164.1 TonB-linked outer membrane protein, SusC/RagA family [Flavobacterium gillisiae]
MKISRKNLLFLLLLFCVHLVNAQTKSISGKVTDSSGFPLTGTTILVKGTKTATIADRNGNYNIKTEKGKTLVFSFMGFTSKEVLINNEENQNIVLDDNSVSLGEVVVTALGIKRDKRALGYASQELKSDDINKVNSANFVSNLTGKISGVQISGSGNGIASSSRITIRGDKSLNINNNGPLFIVDGIPINNNVYGVGGSSTSQTDLPTDYGNGASEINQENIESVNVLKGAAASALYGSRAANGVIVITTKSGKRSKGLGVSISSSFMTSEALRLPEIQGVYGAGSKQIYDAGADTNLGPRFDSGISLLQNGSSGYSVGQGQVLPFEFRYNLNDFFRKGSSISNSVSVSGSDEKTNFRLSYGKTTSEDIVPNSNLKRENISLNLNYNISDKWKLATVATYTKSSSDNTPVTGYGSQGVMYNLLWNHTNVDLDWLKDYWIVKDVKQNSMFGWGDNPFKIAYENINAFKKGRIFGNISSTYQISNDFSFMARIGMDNSNDFRWSRRPIGSSRYTQGMYREQTIAFTEYNADMLLSYDHTFGDFSFKISYGANSMNQYTSESKIEGQGISIPGIYNLQNINVMPIQSRNIYKKRINSMYSLANIGYKDYLYLDVTARNDWSSTLPTNNNSYFYPSASLSFIPTSVFEMNKNIDFLKLRVNAASVGNDTDPYRLVKTYSNGALAGTLTNPSSILNSNLKPEIATSYEAGIEVQFFKKRITLDMSYYITNSKNQIVGLDISQATGFNSNVINAGKIQNKGIEIGLGLTPIRSKDFEWSLNANFTQNRGTVKELTPGINNYIIAQGPNGGTIEARVGERMGDMYGRGYLRSPDNQIVYDNTGSPILDTKIKKIGNYNPDWMLGLSTNLRYKNLNLNALFDVRHGGKIYSMTNAIGMESGILAVSLPGRETGIIGEGVVKNTDGSYSPNTTSISAENWYYSNAFRRDNIEANSFDASYVKLREVSLNYRLSTKWTKAVKMQNVSIGLVGNNLALWTKVPNIDPETQAISGGTLLPGFEVLQLPSSRNYGIKLNASF